MNKEELKKDSTNDTQKTNVRYTKELRKLRYFIAFHTTNQQKFINYLDKLKENYAEKLKTNSQKSISKQIRQEMIKIDREKSKCLKLIDTLNNAVTVLNSFEQFENVSYIVNGKEAQEYIKTLEERTQNASVQNRSE